ncbi:MAG: hypothetical protein ACI935_002126 [Moritella dasanensis]
MNAPLNAIQRLYFPVVVENDIKKKIEARKMRANATVSNIDKYQRELVRNATKSASFIINEFPWAMRSENAKPISEGSMILDHHTLMQDEQLKKLAQRVVNRNIVLVGDVERETNMGIVECETSEDETEMVEGVYTDAIIDAYIRCRKNLSEFHIKAPGHSKKKHTLVQLESYLMKMLCDDWMRKQFMSLRRFYIEYTQVALSRVGDGKHQATYVSDVSYNNWVSSQRDALEFIKQNCLVNVETGENYDLEEVVKRTTANPANRYIEMIVRARGFEELAEEKGYVGIFVTWTLPSKYHKNSKVWDGSSYKKGANRLMKLWGQSRSLLAKNNIDYYGFRVSEPHKDGTPHAHYFLFCNEYDQMDLINILESAAVAECREELMNDITPRFKIKFADPSIGGFTSYIAKYLAKNITGKFLPETEAELNAFKARAWASTHRIRQFQSFGGAAIGLWRAIRKAKRSDAEFDVECLAMYDDADKHRWAGFCKSVKNAALLHEKNISRYGEVTKRVLGVIWDDVFISSTKGRFLMMKKSEAATWIKDNVSQSLVPKSLVSIFGRNGVSPWSTENNCNPSGGAAHIDHVLNI